MLACDLVMDVRASRCLSRDQVSTLERVVFDNGAPGFDELDLLLLIDTYAMRAHATWAPLLARATQARERLEAAASPRLAKLLAA